MKRKFITLIVASLLATTLFVGCSQGSSNDNLGNNGTINGNDDTTLDNNLSQVVSVNVACDYGNIKNGKATLVLSAPIDIKQYKLKSKLSSQTIDNIIVGDELEVTYSEQINSSVSQVLVDTADYIVVNVTKKVPPGGGTPDIFISVNGDQSNVPAIIHNHLDYIIDENGNLINKNDSYEYNQLYAVYTKDNVEVTSYGSTKIILTAIYTCDPRTVTLDYIIDDSAL